MEENLILGCGYGYDLERIAPFLISCREVSSPTRVVILGKPMSASEIREATTRFPDVCFHTPSDHEIREKLQQLPRGGRLLSLLNLFLSRGSGKLPFSGPFPSATHLGLPRRRGPLLLVFGLHPKS